MKKILSTLLAFVMLATTLMAVPFSAQAEVKYPEASGTLLSGQTFTYDSETETLTISGEGAITGYNWTGENVSPFEYCTVKHIVIEEGITSLCNYLFHYVYGIESFSIPASVTTIQVYAMSYATFVGGAGKGITVAEGNKNFCAEDGTLYNKDKTKLIKYVNSDATEFTVPGTVSSIEQEAFYKDVTLEKLVLNGTNLSLQNYAIRGAKIKSLVINEGVKSLGDYCSIDSDVWKDETITLPASLTDIGTQSLFGNKIPIKNFYVADGNTIFSAIDGVLYKYGTTLFSYPGGRTDTSYTVLDGTTKIAGFAFTYRNNLESVDFPASVKNFSGRCLCYCSNLTTVNIRALDAKFPATDCFYGMNNSVVYNVYENSVTHKNLLDYGIEESKIAFLPLCAEHSYQLTKTVEPTCYAKGYDIYTCSVCGATENRNETNMVDHNFVTTYNEDKTIEHHPCKNHGFVIEETENLPESEHDYQSKTDTYFELSYPGADTISITFDDQFKTEKNWDYLMVYDRDGNEIAKYTGTEPAGQTYTLNGDYIKLKFHSDDSGNYYGFKITRVVAEKVGCDEAEPDTPHTHSYGDYVSDGNATCTENGTETATCACGETTNRTEENSALGHDFVVTKIRPATCGADGYTDYECTVCSATKHEDITERPNHKLSDKYDSETNSVITTCANKDGFVVEYTENLPESKHNYENNTSEEYVLEYPDADTISITFDDQFKTETKYDYLMVYDRDGNEIAKYQGTEPAGQTYTLNGDYIKLNFHSDSSTNYYGFKITKVAATYPGCGYETSAPHTTHNVTTYTSNNDATCTEDGTKTGTCTICNKSVTVPDEGSALGHDYDLRAGETPTCTTGGHNLYLCLRCGEDYREELDPLGHDLVKTADAVNPTCFSVGWTAGYKCSRCDYEVRQEEVAKIAHTTKQTVTKATPTADGKVVNTCTVCKKTLSTTVIPKASSIKLSATSYTYNGKVKTPSVTVKDSKGKTLKRNTDYTVSYASGRKYVGKYAVKITFKGNYSGTKTLYFYIKPKTTSISSLSAGSKKFTVKWKKQATQTTGYQIQYSTSSKFTKSKTVTVSKNSTTSKTISKLSGKKKYFVRVRTYKTVKINGKATKIYSSWSKAKAVTTKK